MDNIDRKINELIRLAADVQSLMVGLKTAGVEVNSILISDSGLSVAIRKGIEKAAVAVGAEPETSKSGRSVNFTYENADFGQVKAVV